MARKDVLRFGAAAESGPFVAVETALATLRMRRSFGLHRFEWRHCRIARTLFAR